MRTQSETVRTPKLRFPEYSSEWERKKLSDISTNIMYGVGSASTKFDGVNKYLRITDIDDSSRNFKPKPLTSPQGFIDDIFKLSMGDIVFARTGASVGKTYLYNKSDGNLIFAGFLIRFNVNNAIPYFVYSNTFRSEYDRWVSVMSVRSGQPGINAEEYKMLPINLPAKPEQQKIAAFLTSVDSKIEKLIKKQGLLENYKKGLMQKIFSQEIRFKADDGSDYPDWEEKSLGDIGQTFPGLNNKTKEDFGSGKPYVQYIQIFDNSKININNFGLVNIKDEENQKTVKFGDVLFTTSSETPNEIAYSSVLLDEINELYLNSFCFGFRPNSLDEMSPSFAQFLFRNSNFRRQVLRLAQGSTRYNISKKQLLKEVVDLPTVSEQKEIATFLSSIDSKIEQIDKQLDETKQFKKALLQQMFV
jgi:type I restriction enzyme, S subunit